MSNDDGDTAPDASVTTDQVPAEVATSTPEVAEQGKPEQGPEQAETKQAAASTSAESESKADSAVSKPTESKVSPGSKSSESAELPEPATKVLLPEPETKAHTNVDTDNPATNAPLAGDTRSRTDDIPSDDTDTKPKRKAPPTGLQLQDVPAPEARSVEIDLDRASHVRSRTSTLSQPFTPSMHHAPESPTTSLIGTLRSQLEMYVQQTEQLNAKLVAAVSKHADLEDQVFELQTDKDHLTRNNNELAHAKAQWEISMNTGLLVERSQIRDEMQRLAAGLVEEERKRGTAEEKRKQVEDEVDELSATLFDQANTMVATERMARVQAEQRLKETEDSLAVAEAAVRDMQTHMQSLTTVASVGPSVPHIPRRYLSSHPPYAEFRTLIAYLRAARPSSLTRKRSDVRELYPAPLVTSLVQQPFIARCIAEDYEATLRLEQAADLGWVSRRSVSSAILSGDLLIEPVGSAALGPPESLSCALCGRAVFGGGSAHKGLMKYFSTTNSGPTAHLGSNIYVFRVATQEDSKVYPLCKNGWCLERLRAACALWHFVRTGIVHPVWFGEDHDAAPVTPKRASTAAETDDGTPVRIDLSRTPPEADRLTVSPAPVPQRSVSTPVSGHIAITVENLASAEYRRPSQPPPSRRSGWGLGSFSLGSGGKSGGKSSGGWTSWGSKPSTPASPAEPYEQRAVSAGVLDAPISLEAEKTEPVVEKKGLIAEKKGEPAEKEPVSEPVAEKAEAISEDAPVDATVDEKAAPAANEKVAAPDTADAVAAKRPDSRTSHRSFTSTDHSFATPTGDNASLPDVNGETKEGVEVSDAAIPVTESPEPELKTEESDSPSEPPFAIPVTETPEPELKTEESDSPSEPPFAIPVTETPEPELKAEESDSPSQPPSKPGTPANGANASPTRPARAAGRNRPPPPLPKRSERRGLNTPTPPITPTAPTDPSKAVETTAETKDGETPEETKVEAPEQATEKAEKAETAEVDDTSLPDTAASAAAAAAMEPSTPTTATAKDAVTPTATASPRMPPPRHPLAIKRSPTASSRSTLDKSSMPNSAPALPLRKSVNERSVSTPSTATTASNATAHSPEHDADGRSFLSGEEWEARTWRQVVRFKEDMWRARVGVVDDDE
ncbi:hypothetical protein CspeluHIS016_0104490 [Cutaneotrichosporon spelunceum]|uniref:GDP/GTP exchange factor Sec2 N-terminal domain-containing protein n=1 Tax=Cutaneotrichosporon spelunceum TaxID=1672016 RepID=A0AAD3TMX8_9TREE|nr:hypothetical protein CspeluHIS016_0104490 [Cutaneotrichosporon spelunceum]